MRRRAVTSDRHQSDPAARRRITFTRQSTAPSVHQSCKPTAVARCAAMTCSGRIAASSATSARTPIQTNSTGQPDRTRCCTATTATERFGDAAVVRPSAVRFRARRCPRASPSRGRPSSPIIGSPSALRARSQNRPLAPRRFNGDAPDSCVCFSDRRAPTTRAPAPPASGWGSDPVWIDRGSTPRQGVRRVRPGAALPAVTRRCGSDLPVYSGHSL